MRWIFAALIVGCGGTTSGNPDASIDAPFDSGVKKDAGVADTGADVDNGMPSDTYPFPHPPLPQIVNMMGPVMTTPKVVPIIYASDGYRQQIPQFLAQLAASPFWAVATKEYGVGALSIAQPIELQATPPAVMDDFDIQALLATNIGKNGWPAADPNTIFQIFFPQQTKVTYPKVGNSCIDFWSYHYEMPLDGGGKAAYAVEPRCSKLLGMTGFDVISSRASHDIVNAATNPFPLSAPAWALTDDDDLVWSLYPGPGPASMCAWERQNYVRIVGNFQVNKVWSNISAKASHDPCMPASPDAYFNAAPVFPDTVPLTIGGWGMRQVDGVHIPVGQKKTIDVILFSDAPTDAFTVQAQDVDLIIDPMGTQKLDFAWDRTSGKNGEKLHLTITALDTGPYGGAEFVIWSSLQNTTHTWWGFVGN
jgi:hypothetical protein